MNTTASAVQNYTASFYAERYKVQLKNRLTDEGFWVEYSAEQLVRAVGYLRGKNANGFDVYARPVGWQYVLLDDLTREVLTDVANLKPCLLMETSPGNFQAWLVLPEIPTDRDTAKAICRELASRFGADLGSAEPDHVGRLPGFTNRKEKHRMADGQYPFVKLCRWEYRQSTFYPFGGAVFNLPVTQPNGSTYQHAPGSNSTSEQDFGVACGMIKAGKADPEIYQHLLSTSPDLSARRGRHTDSYLHRTISNARKSVEGRLR